LHNLLRLLGDDDAGLLARTPLVVIGERLAGLAREAGCKRVAVAKEASDHALCEAVISLAHLTQMGL
jgi:uroporphyrinogen-III synthase